MKNKTKGTITKIKSRACGPQSGRVGTMYHKLGVQEYKAAVNNQNGMQKRDQSEDSNKAQTHSNTTTAAAV